MQSVVIVPGGGVPELPAGQKPLSILTFLTRRCLRVGVHATAAPGAWGMYAGGAGEGGQCGAAVLLDSCWLATTYGIAGSNRASIVAAGSRVFNYR